MTKSQLIEAVAARAPHLSKKDVEAVVNLIFASIRKALQRGERVEIRGFGSFTVRERRAREGRNPKTGEKVMVPTRRAPFFTVGKELRDRVNAGRMRPAPPSQEEEARIEVGVTVGVATVAGTGLRSGEGRARLVAARAEPET